MAKKKSNAKLIVIIVVIALIIIVAIGIIISNSSNKTISIVTSKVEKRTITQTVSAVGKIQPETEVKISSQTSGEIIVLGPKEGDRVKTGDLLVKIKPDIIETQLEQSKAAADASNMDIQIRKSEKERTAGELKRLQELYDKKFISKQDLDRAQAAYDQSVSSYSAALSHYEQSKAGYKQIQRTAARTTIYAPMDGIVTALNVEKGEKVVGTEMMQGTEMMRISDLNIMNAVVDVDENDIVYVHMGDTAKIEIDAYPDSIFTGIVVEIGHSAKVSSLGTQDQVTNFEVKVRLINTKTVFRPGMSCNVKIATQTMYDVLAVPLQAVTVRDTTFNKTPDLGKDDMKVDENEKKKEKEKVKRPPSVVFMKMGDKAKMVKVETGISDDGFIEIRSGLKAGDEIISGSFMAISNQLSDGSTIKVDSTYKKKFNKK